MLITNGGVLIRTPANQISVQGRNTQGVRVIALDEDERLVTVDRVEEAQDDAGDQTGDEKGDETEVDTAQAQDEPSTTAETEDS